MIRLIIGQRVAKYWDDEAYIHTAAVMLYCHIYYSSAVWSPDHPSPHSCFLLLASIYSMGYLTVLIKKNPKLIYLQIRFNRGWYSVMNNK